MRVQLDSGRCVGHAMCHAMGPDVYDLDDSGYCIPPIDVVAPGLEEQATAGAAACPERALEVIRD
jgi:ferredoxin